MYAYMREKRMHARHITGRHQNFLSSVYNHHRREVEWRKWLRCEEIVVQPHHILVVAQTVAKPSEEPRESKHSPYTRLFQLFIHFSILMPHQRVNIV